MSVFCRFPRI